MTLHLVKLCVGVEKVEELTSWGRAERGRGGAPTVHTRQTPKRAKEILEGGSLYWVIKGVIQCRQSIVRIETFENGPQTRCEIELEDEVVLTAPAPRRPFQGWRYFEGREVPADLLSADAGDLPPDLAKALQALGAW